MRLNTGTKPVTAAAVGMLVCVDSHGGGKLGGVVYSRLLPEPFAFRDIMQLTGKMDGIYDTYSFPATFFAKRTFGGGKTGGCTVQKEGITIPRESVTAAQGEKGTFLVGVHFRQNATWQGTITWLEKNKKRHFRSALEMIRLMDEALTESGGPNSWEETESTKHQ